MKKVAGGKFFSFLVRGPVPKPSGLGGQARQIAQQYVSRHKLQKKRLVLTSLFFIDINLLRDFRYVINDSICAKALDMSPCGNEIYIISSLSEARKYRIYEVNISSKRSLHIDKITCIYYVAESKKETSP